MPNLAGGVEATLERTVRVGRLVRSARLVVVLGQEDAFERTVLQPFYFSAAVKVVESITLFETLNRYQQKVNISTFQRDDPDAHQNALHVVECARTHFGRRVALMEQDMRNCFR